MLLSSQRLTLLACLVVMPVVSQHKEKPGQGGGTVGLTGKWTAEAPGRNGSSNTVTFKLKSDGPDLTGTMSTNRGGEAKISDGKVSGDNLSFKAVREYNGNKMVTMYRGKIAGDQLKLTMSAEGREGTREITAKRVE